MFHSLFVHRQNKINVMDCRHGKPASATTTKNGLFWYCGCNHGCNFFCPQRDDNTIARAVAIFQASVCPQPVCHGHQKLTKMGVLKDNTKGNGGRSFFVCSDRNNPCLFWQWADDAESATPICCHDLDSCIRKDKKESLTKVAYFTVVPTK